MSRSPRSASSFSSSPNSSSSNNSLLLPAAANSKDKPRKSFTLRGVVSGNRTRYIDDEYDLDLSYITPNIIAMSIPAEGLESTYRNHIDSVSQFINSKHKGRYMIINTTCEKKYSYDKFDNNVLEFGNDNSSNL